VLIPSGDIPLLLIALIVIHTGGAVLLAMYAKRKGYSFLLFLLLGVFASIVVEGVLVLAMPKKPFSQVTAD
jgi:hypothetical protein